MLRKIISGNDGRKSRLHDEKGNRVSFDRVLRNMPKAISTGFCRKLFDSRPQLPWISYDAIRFFESFLTKEKSVLEFGSGMSTAWYAKHAGQVYSVEDYEPWYLKIRDIIVAEKLQNIDYQFKSGEEYSGFMKDSGICFDMIMIDGSNRSACAANAVDLVKDGGVIYLDNSDKHSSEKGGDTRFAENILLGFAREHNARIEYFTDFCPCEFFVQQGMLVRLQ